MAGSYDRAAHAAHAASFGAAADAYERGRPTYPPGAVDWLLPDGARQVVDLGAGTGKLTRDLVARGLDVTAVEPSSPMLDRLRAVVPGARALVGTAEEVPVPGASADAVLVAQAWHWVDEARAVPEVARVLRPGGHLGLVWNVRVEDAGWSAALSALLDEAVEHRTDGLGPREPGLGEAFGPFERHQVAWTHRCTREEAVGMVASRSYVITLPDERRHRLLEAVRQLLVTHPDLAGAEEVAVPYLTHCFRARRC